MNVSSGSACGGRISPRGWTGKVVRSRLTVMFRALPSEDLPAGEGPHTQIRRIRVGEGHILVARLNDGGVVAFAPRCPHQVTALDDATISDDRLRCPRHGYSYDTQSGENVHPRRDNRPEDLWKLRPGYLPCFEVAERDGWIWVETEPKPPPPGYDPALEEPPPERRSSPSAAALPHRRQPRCSSR